jgi:hypothetical protein
MANADSFGRTFNDGGSEDMLSSQSFLHSPAFSDFASQLFIVSYFGEEFPNEPGIARVVFNQQELYGFIAHFTLPQNNGSKVMGEGTPGKRTPMRRDRFKGAGMLSGREILLAHPWHENLDALIADLEQKWLM